MEPNEREHFFLLLKAMGALFCDDPSFQRRLLYWDTLKDDCTIDEMDYAARQAMQRETFYKLPLPAHLLDYVREYRRQCPDRVLQGVHEEGS